MNYIINELNNLIWGFPMIIILLSIHILMTIKTRAVQRHTLKAIKLSITKNDSENGDITPFQALAASLASTIGTGSIIGLGTAVALGGAGAVFWCWITGILGIATKYAESLIAVKYRVYNEKGTICAGAMYVLENRLNMKAAAVLFAVQ